MSGDTDHDDSYPTCFTTHATLLVYQAVGFDSESIDLGSGFVLRTTGAPRFELASEGTVDSRDTRRHIDWLLDAADAERDGLHQLQNSGCELVASIFWVSRYGHGGPTLRADQLSRLGELGFEVQFDIYFDDTTPEWEEVEIDGEIRMVTRHV